MKKIKYYWSRFMSETPKTLKSLQKVMGSISAATASMSVSLLAFDKTKSVAITLGIVSAIAAGIAAGLQFATSDSNIAEQK